MTLARGLQLVVVLFGTQGIELALKQESAVVLSGREARSVLTQCSRVTPAVQGFWMPDIALVRDADEALVSALDRALAQKHPGAADRPVVSDYYRQYVGIQSGGRRLLYVNGFHENLLAVRATARQDIVELWRTQAVDVCDGGTMFFGAEYDPATGTFQNVRFNAPAG